MLGILALAFTLSGQTAELSDLSIEDLMNVKVVSASKNEESVAEATSIMSVITRQDIESSGLMSLYDFLKRIPGFFPSQQATWSLLTSRGLPSDSTDHFLLLIDGHRQNSIVGQGFQQQDLIPTLDQVEQIEIIRGPGSVMWGSSAVMGLINVITRKHIDRPKVTVSAQYGAGPSYTNFTEGIGDGDAVKGFYSFTAWKAKGYRYRKDGESAVAFPWGSQPSGTGSGPSPFNAWPEINRQREGFDLYGKVNLNKRTEVVARILKTSFNYVWDDWSSNNRADHELGNRRSYLSIRRFLNPTDRLSLDFNIYGDYNLQNRDPVTFKTNNSHTRVEDQTNEEFALGTEATASLKVSESNRLKLGIKAVRTRIGPNRGARLNALDNTPIGTGSDTDTNGDPFSYDLPYFGVKHGVDNAVAIYGEDSQTFDATTVFVGGRVDHNDFREQGTIFLPRGGVIQKFSPRLIGKYTYNTGYLRPSAVYSKTTGTIVDTTRGGAYPISRVTSSESVRSHDMQLSYNDAKLFGAVTLFYMEVTDFISFDANNSPQGYKNIGTASTKGIELEGRMKVVTGDVYGNFSHSLGKISSQKHEGALSDPRGRTLNYPAYITNVGTNVLMGEKGSINLNVLSWTNMRYIRGKDQIPAGRTAPVYGTMGMRSYMDINLRRGDFLAKDLDANLFVWNVFENQERVGMVVNNGTYRPPGRSVGMRFGYEF